MNSTASYVLSAYSFLFKYTIDKILDVGYQSKNGNPIPSFDENILIDLCREAKEIFEKESNILRLDGDLIVVGDIHGSLHDLLRIIHYIQEKKRKALFLGDYIDRGNFSLECITLLFALKIIRPDLFYLIRGNHEFDVMCSQYGFKKEISNYYNPKKPVSPGKKLPSKSILIINLDNDNTDSNSQSYEDYLADHTDMNCYKYTESLYDAFIKAFSYLPVCAIWNDTTFCIHGGLSPKFDHVEEIEKHINRPINQFEENLLLTDLIWGDPYESYKVHYGDNPRGRGYLFNRVAVNTFLSKNSLKRIIRAHECVSKGVHKIFDDKCITVFSASSYDKNLGNHSGILELFQQDDRVEVKTFSPIERLQKSDTLYFKVQNYNDDNDDRKIPFSLLYPFLSVNSHINLSLSQNCIVGQKRKSRNSINSSRSSPLIKPGFTTRSRKSCNHLPQSPSMGSFNPVKEHKDPVRPKIPSSQSMPKFF